MQHQLFLFEASEEKLPGDKPPLKQEAAPEADAPQVMPEQENKGKENMFIESEPPVNENVEETITDPFEANEKKLEAQVENMLLLPNTRRGRKSFKDMDAEVILVAVPDDEELYKKQYYPMRIVAEWFGITPSQLRNWENEFDILKPKKNAKGDRFFRPDDVKNLQLIYHLIRRRKFTVQGAKQYLDENRKNLQATMQLTDSLNKLKQFLTELKAITG